MTRALPRITAAAVLALALLAAACGDDGGGGTTGPTSPGDGTTTGPTGPATTEAPPTTAGPGTTASPTTSATTSTTAAPTTTAPFDGDTTIGTEIMVRFSLNGYQMRGFIDRLSAEDRERTGATGTMSAKEALGHIAFWDGFTVRFFKDRLNHRHTGSGLADFEVAGEGALDYIHRRDGATDIFFVANRPDKPLDARCIFRVAGKAPELWNPVTGERSFAAAYEERLRSIRATCDQWARAPVDLAMLSLIASMCSSAVTSTSPQNRRQQEVVSKNGRMCCRYTTTFALPRMTFLPRSSSMVMVQERL